MQTEIEAKFIDIDINEMRQRLERVGAVLEQPMRDMRRALIEEPQHAAEHSFIRIRDEGDQVTLTYKRHAENDAARIDSAREIETTVGDFDATIAIFEASGWHFKTYQESRRETWKLGDVEIVIDEWPWIQPYIEIEAQSSDEVQNVAELLGFSWDDAVFGTVDVIYNRDFPAMTVRGVIDIHEVRFSDPIPAEFKPKGVAS